MKNYIIEKNGGPGHHDSWNVIAVRATQQDAEDWLNARRLEVEPITWDQYRIRKEVTSGFLKSRPERVIAALTKNQKERDEKNRRLLAKLYSMNEPELREAMKTRPALVKIDAILGKNATPDQKMELFRLLQGYVEQAIQRTIRDLNFRPGKPG